MRYSVSNLVVTENKNEPSDCVFLSFLTFESKDENVDCRGVQETICQKSVTMYSRFLSFYWLNTHTHTNMTVPHTHTQIHTHAPTFETSCTTIWSTSLFSFFFFGYWPVDVLSVASGHSRRRGADLQNSRIGRAGLAGCAETRVSTGWLRLTSCKAGWLSLTLPCLLPLAE